MSQEQKRGVDIVVTGRMVWGGVTPKNKKIYGTSNDQLDKEGKPVIEYSFGLAIPKPSPQASDAEKQNFMTIWNAIHAEAAKLNFQQGRQDFAWKFVDGDGKKKDGSDYPSYYKGCLVFAMATRIPLKLSAWEGNELKQVTPDQIKCGDYIQVALNVNAHGAPNAGMYLNPSYIARYAYGEAIIVTPDATTVFGNMAPPMPMGGSAQPTAPMGMPSMGQPPAQPQYQQPQPPVQQSYYPNPNVLPQNMQQQYQAPAQQQYQQPVQQQAPTGAAVPPWQMPQ